LSSYRTDLFEDEARIQRKTALPERVVDDLQLLIGQIFAALSQPLPHQTDAHFVAERRHFQETADGVTVAVDDGGLRQPTGLGLERVEGRVLGAGGEYEVDVGRYIGRQPVQPVGAMIGAQLIESVQQNHQRSISRGHLHSELSFIHYSFIYLHSSKNIIHNKMYMHDNKAAYTTLTVALYNWEIKHYCTSRTH